jgi:hypothetical protein
MTGEKKLEKILMIYDHKESHGILTHNEYDNFLREIIRLFEGLEKRDYRITILNTTYSVLYDPDIFIEYNLIKLVNVIGKAINNIIYPINLKDGVITKVSKRLVKNTIENGTLEKIDFNNCYKKSKGKYIEITKVTNKTYADLINTPSILSSSTAPIVGYGICKRCGKPIPKERLAIFPNTENCVACIEEVQTNNPRKHVKMKDIGIAGSRKDVKRGRGRSWGDH